MKIPTLAVIDHRKKRITLDGRDIAPGSAIADHPTVEVIGGLLTRVDVGLYAANVLVLGADGRVSSPSARAEGTAIVRRGLADVLAWLGESQ